MNQEVISPLRALVLEVISLLTHFFAKLRSLSLAVV